MSVVIHLLLFGCVAVPIVVLSAFYADADDARALRALPKRAWHFFFGCGLLAAILIACEHLFGSVR
ncbi:MAG: hypothetical protein L6Q99_09210 [Planctomycetes bacterium]|nr:hypothetical protein [Planctomycetota bacterium]